MTCKKHVETLIEMVAAGGTLAPETAHHLESCAQCCSTLEHEQRLFAAIDEQLRASVNEQPSAGFLAGVQARIAQASRSESGWNPMWTLAGAAVALILIALAHPWGGLRKPPVEESLAAPVARRPLTTDAGQRRQKTGEARLTNPPARAHKQTLVQPGANPDPEVLVPPDEALAFVQFVARVAGRDERAEAVVRPMRDETELTPIDIADLQVQLAVDDAK